MCGRRYRRGGYDINQKDKLEINEKCTFFCAKYASLYLFVQTVARGDLTFWWYEVLVASHRHG